MASPGPRETAGHSPKKCRWLSRAPQPAHALCGARSREGPFWPRASESRASSRSAARCWCWRICRTAGGSPRSRQFSSMPVKQGRRAKGRATPPRHLPLRQPSPAIDPPRLAERGVKLHWASDLGRGTVLDVATESGRPCSTAKAQEERENRVLEDPGTWSSRGNGGKGPKRKDRFSTGVLSWNGRWPST